MTNIEKYSEALFERIKHVNEYNQEFWYARELQEVLEYSQWRRFHEVISKAMKACESSGYEVDDHFANVGKMIVNLITAGFTCFHCLGNHFMKSTPL